MGRELNTINEPFLKRLAGRVLVLTGSGISADSGIPTFRGEGGYWRNYKAEDLATQTAFDRHPDVVWQWYRERRAIIKAAQPNAAHVALVALAERCREFLLVTQNVDDLHERASFEGRTLPASRIVHIHGNIFVTRCPKCGHSETDHHSSPAPETPRCPVCRNLMRPGVVWFDEELDPNETSRVEDFLRPGDCDAVLVIGTTAIFDYVQQWAMSGRGKKGWLAEINPDETSLSRKANQVFRERAADVLPGLVHAMPAPS